MKYFPVRISALVISLAVTGGLFLLGLSRADIDTDITRYLPRGDRTVGDALYIWEHHPLQERIAIDLSSADLDRDQLVDLADRIENRLRQSGLFADAGMTGMQTAMPGLLLSVVRRLPVLFTAEDLERRIAPRLTPEAVQNRVRDAVRRLSGLDGVGRAGLIAADPLGFYEPVMARLSLLDISGRMELHRGRLFADDAASGPHHLLLTARPSAPGSDTAAAARMVDFFDTLSRDLNRELSRQDPPAKITITPIGAFRHALDNECIARRDVRLAMGLATTGIAILLLFAFSRPLIGFLAFAPALFGVAAGLVVLTLAFPRVSLMALGFGGALISITVDHGIAFLLFCDRDCETTGAEAAREIRSVGLITALTTMGAFGALAFSGFPVLAQVGIFSAAGIGASFLFVHTAFPRILPVMPPAAAPRTRMAALADAFYRAASGRPGLALLLLVIGLALPLLFPPSFSSRLSDMNTVGPATQKAGDLFADVWGDAVSGGIHVMVEGGDETALRDRMDDLEMILAADPRTGGPPCAFLPSRLYPGGKSRKRNFAAWRAFWTPERIAGIKANLASAAVASGFRPGAFAPFIRLIRSTAPPPVEAIPADLHAAFGIRRRADGRLSQISRLMPGPGEAPGALARRLADSRAGFRVLDPDRFSQVLGGLLARAFRKMLAVTAAVVALLIFFFFLDWRLLLAALTPPVLAFAATLGVSGLAGRSLDIPGLMLAIIVFGMGVDYTLYFIRSRLRYHDLEHPWFRRVRLAVLMAGASSLLGFGVLCAADHSLLRSAGFFAATGISASLAAAFFVLPPLLEYLLALPSLPGKSVAARVLFRFRNQDAHPRVFAWVKMKVDPLFRELLPLLDGHIPRVILDIGCGIGVPGAYLLESFPGCVVYGIDPNPRRTAVADAVFGRRGRAETGAAPRLPRTASVPDTVLMLDMLHFLDDADMAQVLDLIHRRLPPGGRLMIRAVVPPGGKTSLMWKQEDLKLRIQGIPAYYRAREDIALALISRGFGLPVTQASGGNPESAWYVAVRPVFEKPSADLDMTRKMAEEPADAVTDRPVTPKLTGQGLERSGSTCGPSCVPG